MKKQQEAPEKDPHIESLEHQLHQCEIEGNFAEAEQISFQIENYKIEKSQAKMEEIELVFEQRRLKVDENH
jgi:hypothetical protein